MVDVHVSIVVMDAVCSGRFGLATILTTVVVSLEELVIERCYDLITTAAFRAMGGCKKLKVSGRAHAYQCSPYSLARCAQAA